MARSLFLLSTLSKSQNKAKIWINRFKKATRFHGEDWIAFVGYLMSKPFEIFIGIDDPEIFPILKEVDYGKIIKNFDEDGNIRFDVYAIYEKKLFYFPLKFTPHKYLDLEKKRRDRTPN